MEFIDMTSARVRLVLEATRRRAEGGTVEFIENTGPTELRELEQAIKAVESILVGGILSVPPALAIELVTIRRALREYAAMRLALEMAGGART